MNYFCIPYGRTTDLCMNEDQKTRVTIVTVVYNGSELLEKTIQSVIGQTYDSIEYIIIDGCSIDNTVDIVRKYESFITNWISEKDDGIYSAMNKGIRMASGDWICFLNCGDVFADENSLAIVAKEIARDTENADIFYGNIFVEGRDGKRVERIAKAPCNLHRMYFCHQSAFVKTNVLRNYFFDERYKMSADFNFFKLCYRDKYKFVHLNVPLVVYDRTGVSNTRREKGLYDNIAVIKNVDTGFEKYKFLLRLYFTVYWRRISKRKNRKLRVSQKSVIAGLIRNLMKKGT